MSVRSQAYQISVFKRYYSDQHFSEFYLGPTIGVNSYWAQGLKPPPHFYDHGARLYDEPPTFVT